MRPARPVTGAAVCAVTIAALGLFTTGQPAYADEAGTVRTGPVAAPPAARGVPEEQGGDGSGDGRTPSGSDAPFGLNVPSLLDSVGGLNAFSGLGKSSGDEGSNERGSRDQSEGEDASQRDSSSGRDNASGRDKSSGNNDSSSGHDDSSSGRDQVSSERDKSSGHDDSSRPDGPSGHVKTGVGGSVRSDTTQIAAGAGVLASAAVGGAWLLRRRASGTQEAG
ncbi:hypothetical protein [Streptomyces sp. NPDC014734]|uniref:hypothetical protein n=1 Tax=Streptomyces sp. NPDC014734 TaxID=3364886 RepID=UPI0036F9DDB7